MKLWFAFHHSDDFCDKDRKVLVVHPDAGGQVSLFNNHFIEGTEDEVRQKIHEAVDKYFSHRKDMQEMPKKAEDATRQKQLKLDLRRKELRENPTTSLSIQGMDQPAKPNNDLLDLGGL